LKDYEASGTTFLSCSLSFFHCNISSPRRCKMSTSRTVRPSSIVSPANAVPLTTIYAIPVDTATPSFVTTLSPVSSAAPTTEANALPTSIIAAGGVAAIPTFTYRIGPAASSSATSSPPQASQISIGAKAGIGVGCGLIFVSLIVGLFIFFRRRKQKLIAQNPNDPRSEHVFSPAHTTYEKGNLEARAYSRTETLHNYNMASRVDTSRSGTPGSGMAGKMESRSNSRLGQNSNRNDSRQTDRSGSPLNRRVPSRNSLYQGRITPNSNKYIYELETPTTPSDGYYSPSTIHELGSEKGDIEIEHQRDDNESVNDVTDEPVVMKAQFVELPDTSRTSVKNWNRRTASLKSTTSRPTIREVREHRSIPVPPVPEDPEIQTSWFSSASGPTTPTNSRFAS
jgi:hypothetical protein